MANLFEQNRTYVLGDPELKERLINCFASADALT